MKKIVFCWPTISGYMAACWRALLKYQEIKLLVIAWLPDAQSNVSYGYELMDGIPAKLFQKDELHNYAILKKLIISFEPDVLVISGWNIPIYRKLVFDRDFVHSTKILTLDNPLRGDLRQKIGKLVLKNYLKKFNFSWVPGQRAYKYARFLGFREDSIIKGLYGINFNEYKDIWKIKYENGVLPKRFLFIGQYIKRKGLHILINAYSKYRNSVAEPWELICCGDGPLKKQLNRVIGIKDYGFVQPVNLENVFLESSVFVLPSLYDAWPLVIVESCSAGLPVICSNACGSSDELVKDYRNGIIVPANDAKALSDALIWFHNNYNKITEMGRVSLNLAEPYSAENWAIRLLDILKFSKDKHFRRGIDWNV